MKSIFFFFTLATAVVSCTKQPAESASIIIGEYEALTGPESAYGTDTHRGIQLAVDLANVSGGVGGKKIILKTYDDQGRADEAMTAVERLIAKDHALVILGEVASTRSIAAAGVAQQYKVPMITPASTNPKVTQVGDYIFRICFIDPFQGLVMAKFALDSLNLRRGAIFTDVKSDYSVGLAQTFKEEFLRRGGKLVSELSYSGGDTDFKTQVVAFKSTHADFLFIPGYYTDVGLIARQARELSFKGVLLGGDGWDSTTLKDVAGSSIVGGYFSNHYSEEMKSAALTEFLGAYYKTYSETPNSSVALGYDAARIAIEAARSTENPSPKSIQKALLGISKFPGVTGSISFSKDRNVEKPAVVLKISPDFTFRFIATVQP